MIYTICILAAIICGTTISAAPADRKAQVFIPRGLYSTAQYTNWMRPSLNNSLAKVDMWYDFDQDGFSYYKGKNKPWNPPMVFWWQTDYWKQYLEPSSCLGPSGVLGYKGPLGSYGPIGNNTWDPVIDPLDPTSWSSAYWMWFRSIAGWSFNMNVSLGEDGPLGKAGPLTLTQMYSQMYHLNALFGANDFAINLDVTGVWGVLGPLSLLGPLGILGALGPLGPHMYNSSVDGQYRNNRGDIVRSLTVEFDKSKGINRVYDLFEMYPSSTAFALGGKNDASFATEGWVNGPSDLKQRFRFTSSRNQSITVTALAAGAAFSDLDLIIYRIISTGDAVEIIRSATPSTYSPATGLIDWTIFHASTDDVYEALIVSPSATPSRYRLMVLGTGFKEGARGQEVDIDLFNHLNIVGPHQSNFCNTVSRAC